jgi:hypothetical protein
VTYRCWCPLPLAHSPLFDIGSIAPDIIRVLFAVLLFIGGSASVDFLLMRIHALEVIWML